MYWQKTRAKSSIYFILLTDSRLDQRVIVWHGIWWRRLAGRQDVACFSLIVTLQSTTPTPLNSLCASISMVTTVALVTHRRTDGSADFYRRWREYENGFGDPKNEFWLGKFSPGHSSDFFLSSLYCTCHCFCNVSLVLNRTKVIFYKHLFPSTTFSIIM